MRQDLGLGSKAQGLGFKVQGSGLRGLRCRVSGSRLTIRARIITYTILGGSFIMIIPYSNHEGPYIWVEFAVCLLALVQSLPLELLSELQPFSEDRPFRAWGV